MKNNILRIILFLIIVMLPPIVWLGLKVSDSDLYYSLQVELGENRDPSRIDSLGELLTKDSVLTDYFADRAPFRNIIIMSSRKINGKLEVPYEKGIMPLAMKLYDNRKVVDLGASHVKPQSGSKEDAYNDLFGNTSSAETEVSVEPETPETSIEEPQEHNFVLAEVTEATCYLEGEERYVCEDCQEEKVISTPKLEHSYQRLGRVEASYTSYGFVQSMCMECGKVIREEITDRLIDDSFMAPILKENEVIIGRYNWLFLAGDGNLPYYKHENVLSDEEMDEYVKTFTMLNEICRENGKKFAVIIAPNKDQVYSDYMPTFTFESDENRTEKLVNYIKSNSDVPISYMLDELKYADRFWQLYYKLDTHWNKMGAFIGTQALLKLLDKPVTNPENIMFYETESNKTGDLVSLGALNPADYPPDKDFVIDYKPEVTVTPFNDWNPEVSVYYKTYSDAYGTGKLFLAGDSFRINMMQYLEKEYEECTFVYKDNLEDGLEDLFAADTIVIEAVERMDYKSLEVAKQIIEYFNNK